MPPEAAAFWRGLERLVAEHPLTIDRPRGSAHPRYPDLVYPLDYGFLAGTRSGDGAGVDVWVGRLPDRALTAILCTVDTQKGEAEIKLLLGCAPEECQRLVQFHNAGAQSAVLLERPADG